MAVIDKFNINGTDYDLRDSKAVRFDEAQTLTDAQKQVARENIGTVSATDFDNSLPLKGVPNSANYNNLISHITESGKYQIQGNTWQDLPYSMAGAMMVFRYGNNYVAQMFLGYTTGTPQAYYRIVHRTNYSVYMDWMPMSQFWRKVLSKNEDLDTLLPGTYYYTDDNLPASPPFDSASIVICIKDGGTDQAAFQIAIHANESGAPSIKFRARAATTWSEWSENKSGINYVRRLLRTDDLNDVITDGIWFFNDKQMPVNYPGYNYGGVVMCYGSDLGTSQRIQLFVGYGGNNRQDIAFRSLAVGNWNRWQYLKSFGDPALCNHEGKRLSILGDSISSYAGYVPTGTGYAAYYTGNNCGVSSVDETWWMRLINETGMKLCRNNSVSGSCLSTGARQDRISGCRTERTGNLSDDDSNAPDYIIVYMGMNDWLNSVPIGEYDGTGAFPMDTSTFREAFAIAMLAIQNNYPNAKVFVCTTEHTESGQSTQKPVMITNGVTQTQFNEVIREMARLFSCEIIDFERCGINTGNVSQHTGDGSKLHPNASGHYLMFREAMRHF